jgi:hypothetical protein
MLCFPVWTHPAQPKLGGQTGNGAAERNFWRLARSRSSRAEARPLWPHARTPDRQGPRRRRRADRRWVGATMAGGVRVGVDNRGPECGPQLSVRAKQRYRFCRPGCLSGWRSPSQLATARRLVPVRNRCSTKPIRISPIRPHHRVRRLRTTRIDLSWRLGKFAA